MDLPEDVSLGRARLIAIVGGREYTAEIKIDRFKKPEFSVKVVPSSKWSLTGSKLDVTVSAKYLFGGSVRKAKVSLSVTKSKFHRPLWEDALSSWFYSAGEYRVFEVERVANLKGETNAEGKCKFTIVTKEEKGNFIYRIRASVDDGSGIVVSGGTTVVVTSEEFALGIKTCLLYTSPSPRD